ncbi:hypothetical protein JOC54_000527 [Alkalihalobacillus xiaoxiensis]|uniref:Cytochrome C biogenesis protein n=1 Tax=Shouchella xiaoxiensis TaxID=766895 RepID=A0ABS2SQJ7_9BACI|nr:cytochrome C biogenesis protein [Shouchella xiaoxiensis]MBM7837296.1 hypothetical protein [Shouchella xiaoxiensis]
MTFTRVKIEVYLPEETIVPLRNELNEQGLLTVDHYDHVVSYTEVRGYWRPLQGADPVNGRIGELCYGPECKMEFSCNYHQLPKVKQLIETIHPYEKPVYYVIPLFV